MKRREYRKGDIVGVVGNCMAEFLILGPHGKKNYKAKCLTIHASESDMKIGTEYSLAPNRIVLKLLRKK